MKKAKIRFLLGSYEMLKIERRSHVIPLQVHCDILYQHHTHGILGDNTTKKKCKRERSSIVKIDLAR